MDAWLTRATLQIGDATLTGQQLVVMDFSSAQTPLGGKVCGALGKDFFDRFVVRIDPAQKTVTLSLPTAELPENKGTMLPLTFGPEGLPRARGKIAGVEGTFLLDTGSSAGAVLNGPFVEKNHLREKLTVVPPPPGTAYAAGGVGGSVEIEQCAPTLLELGALSGKSEVFLLPDNAQAASEDGIIGAPVLFQAPVTFDYFHKQMILEAEHLSDAPPSS